MVWSKNLSALFSASTQKVAVKMAAPSSLPICTTPGSLPSSEGVWRVEDPTFDFGNIDDYLLVERIGRGKYSTVFSGRTKDGNPCALKVLKPVRGGKIDKEIAILHALKDGPNVPQVLDVVYDPESQSITIVMELIENVDFRCLYNDFTDDDIRFYMFEILRAVEFAHSKKIMHRDIKPQNIMIDHRSKKVRLIDWGLAEYYKPDTSYQVRVATRHYKAPELLLGLSTYTMSVDVWGVGVSFATMLFKRCPVFQGRDNNEVLMKLVHLFGSEPFEEYIKKFGIQVPPSLLAKLQGHKAKGWGVLMKDHVVDEDALDLLEKMVTIDHTERITAAEAMEHPYFDKLKCNR